MSATVIQLTLPETTYLSLTRAAEQENKTAVELAVEVIETYFNRLKDIDPLLGLFADEPELIDQMVEDVMLTRSSTPLRLPEVAGG